MKRRAVLQRIHVSKRKKNKACPTMPASLLKTWRTILFADLVESVRLMEVDELGTIEQWQRFVDAICAGPLARHGGRLIRSLGDGLLIDFDKPIAAVRCAFELLALVREHSGHRPADRALQLRIGVHEAEVVIDRHDVFGAGVNLASRLASRASPGQLICSEQVRWTLLDDVDAEIEDLGDCYFKHVERPVRAYRLRQGLADGEADATRTDDLDARPTIAVVPLLRSAACATGSHGVGDLIADAVIVRLSKNPCLRVVSRLSSAAIRHRSDGLPDAARHLRASHLLTGSFVRAGGTLTVHAQLCESALGQVLWAERWRGPESDVLRFDGELATLLATSVADAVVGQALAEVRLQPIPNLPSYVLQLAAIGLMHRRSGLEFERVGPMLEELIERHPRHAMPRAWLAKWHVLRVTRGIVAASSTMAGAAMDHTRRALDADPECSLARAMQGFVHCHIRHDLPAAMATLDETLRRNSSESLAWLFKSVVHSLWGEGQAALAAAHEARRLSPLDPLRYYYDSLASTAALAAGDDALAMAWAHRSLRANPLHSPTLRALAIAQAQSGLLDEARASVLQLRQLDPELTVQSYLARSPAGSNEVRRRYADALSRAGLPAQ